MKFDYKTSQQWKNGRKNVSETIIQCLNKESNKVIRSKCITNGKTPAEAALIFANFVNDCETTTHDLPVTPIVRAVNRQISIYVNGNWAGSGQLDKYGFICNCGCNFCEDTDASMRVYDEIDQAIADGEDRVVTYVSGEREIITWLITGEDVKVK